MIRTNRSVMLYCFIGNLFHPVKAAMDEKSAVAVAKRRTLKIRWGIRMVRTYPITLIPLLAMFSILSVDG